MPPRDVFEGDPTRGQRERLEAQTGGRRGSTRTRSDQDPRGMYGPREQTGTVTVDLGGDRGTREVATYGGPTQQGINIGFDPGSGEKAGTLSFQEFMNVTGRSETNPYGKQGFFSRVFGIDPNKINYATNTPGGIATLAKVNALAYDQYLNPRDAQGNIRGFLREGSPTRFGTVVNDPTLEKDLGIMGAIPYIGGFLRAANRRSALNISPYDNPLFSEMGDIGFELGEFPEGSVAAAPVAQAAPTDGPPPDVVRDPTASSLPTIEELTADREGRDIRRQEEQQQRTDREARAVSAVLEMLQNAANNRAEARTPAATSIPTTQELLGDRIKRTVAELQAATADFPDQFSVAPEVDFEVGQSATGEDFPVTISDVLQGPITRSISKEVTVGDEAARLVGENRTRDEVAKQLVSQGVDPAEARSRANKAVYLTGDTANPRTSFEIGRGADPMAAAFESGLPSDLLRSYGLL